MAVSFWSAVPTVANDGTTPGINVGIKFKANVAGTITHLRYYEQTGTTGTVTLRLVDNAATVLASATHTAVNGQVGWREVALGAAYAVTANSKFLIYSHIPNPSGNNLYGTINTQLLSTARTTSGNELETLVDGAETFAGSTGNGVYTYGNIATPVSTFGSSNYALDVVFESGPPPVPDETSANSDATVALWNYAGMSTSDGSF